MSGEVSLQRADGTEQDQQGTTRMENESKRIGRVTILAYDEIGAIEGVHVEARQVGVEHEFCQGALVTVIANEHLRANAYVDEIEIPELIAAVGKMLAIEGNPTQFRFFEVKYRTKGGLEISAFNDRAGNMHYSIRAGAARRTLHEKFAFGRIKVFLEAAAKKLISVSTANSKV